MERCTVTLYDFVVMFFWLQLRELRSEIEGRMKAAVRGGQTVSSEVSWCGLYQSGDGRLPSKQGLCLATVKNRFSLVYVCLITHASIETAIYEYNRIQCTS